MATWEALVGAAKTTGFALVVLCSSFLVYCIVYRAVFHPLATFPGPLLAKFTNLYAAYHAWKGDIHLDMWRCHQKYGDRVRYGPNRVLINTPKALHDIYGHSAHVKKYTGYEVLASQAPNTLTLSDKTQHGQRRRVISQAFSESSMRLFEPTLLSRIDRFCQILRNYSEDAMEWSKPLDMACQFNYLTFDSLTAVAFGADYRTMEEPEFRYVREAIAETNIRLGVTYQATELTIGHMDRRMFPKSTRAGYVFVKFLRKLLSTRLEQKTHSKDIFSFLQQCKDPNTGEGLSAKDLSTETATFLVAGSDTTSTTMSAVSHYLSESPRCYRRVAEEIRTTFGAAEEIRLGPKLNSCVYLRACIDEALRLSPPGGASFWREVETGGASIGGDFLPEGCEVGVGVYAMHHHPDYWVDPFVYKPDRWLDNKSRTKEQTDLRLPYFPFNIGGRSCVGKPLALSQIMLTYARLFWEFDFRKAESDLDPWKTGIDDDAIPTEYVLKDHVSGQNEGPILCFKARF
ncbi:cytochrome P450 [Xylariaceae sp. FL1651]|nr:cytochrome P450 [Xylariaceae sp. FL1651]